MDKKITYGIIGIIFIVALLGLFFIVQTRPTVNYSGTADTQYIKELENAYSPTEWIISGDSVYVDDENVFINVTPHTSFNPIINFTSKHYSGDVDIVIGLNTHEVKPISALTNPHYVNVEKSYTCEHEFNYTENPKYFWCYKTVDYVNGTSDTIILFSHSFESGDLEQKTAYWTDRVLEWDNINKNFDYLDLNFENMTRWYYMKNINIVAGQNYYLKLNLEPFGVNINKSKYWFAIKPSDETLLEAIANNHLYALDPWTPDLNTNLYSYYKLDATSGAVVDNIGNNDGTDNGATRGVTGKINYAFDWVQADSDYVLLDGNMSLTADFTINLWAYVDDASSHILAFKQGTVSNSNRAFFDTTAIAFQGVSDYGTLPITVTTGSWHMYTIRRIGTNVSAFKDGVYSGSDTITGTFNFNSFGSKPSFSTGIDYYDGKFDEIGIWIGTGLSQALITALYNSGSGITYQVNPNVNIVYPVNNIVYSETVTQLNYTTDSSELCWYSKDGGTTNQSYISAGTNFTVTSSSLWNNWTVYCNSSVGDVGFNKTNFYVNKSAGTILISPPSGSLTTNQTVLFTYNSTPINVNLTNGTFYLWYDNNTLRASKFYLLSGNETITNESIYNLTDDGYKWNAQTCGNDGYCNFASSNFTFTLDTTPPTFNLTYPQGTLGAVIEGTTLFLNWTLEDENIIKNCSYTYNDIVTNLANTTCVQNYTTFNYVAGKDNLSMIVYDIFNNSITDTTAWIVSLSEINQSYQNTTLEGSYESFAAWFTLYSGLDITSATLIYNGTSYSGTVVNPESNYYYAHTNIVIPTVEADTNLTFFWRFVLNDTSIITSLSHNQTVLNVNIDNCTAYSTKLYNFTNVDEEEQTLVANGTIEVAFNLYDYNRESVIANYSNIWNNDTNHVSICLSEALNGSLNLSMDGIIRYEAENHANEYYYIVNDRILSTTKQQNITLYDLNLSDSTEFQLTFTGDDYLPVENALVYIDRQYISENVFKTVELPLTDSNGQTIIHLVRNDVIYNIRVIKDGVLLGTFNNLVAYCEDYTIGDCKINLNSADSNTDIFNYDDQLGITFSSPTFNETNSRLSFSYVSTDGSSKVVSMNVTRDSILGNRSVCNSTTTGASGTLLCSLSSVQDSSLRVNIYVNGELVITKTFTLSGNNYGEAGYLVFFVMAISFILLFSNSKSGILIGVFIGFISGVGLGIITGSVIGLGAAGLWLLVIIIIGLYKLNKNRPQ